MRHYLVDGSNVVRRGNFDPRFPEMDESRTIDFLDRLSGLAEACSGKIRIEVFFDGPRRPIIEVAPPIYLRFAIDGYADAAIIGTARGLLAQGRGAVIVTMDGRLSEELAGEGARIMGISEFESRLREGRA